MIKIYFFFLQNLSSFRIPSQKNYCFKTFLRLGSLGSVCKWCAYEESNFANIMNRRISSFSAKFEFCLLQIFKLGFFMIGLYLGAFTWV